MKSQRAGEDFTGEDYTCRCARNRSVGEPLSPPDGFRRRLLRCAPCCCGWSAFRFRLFCCWPSARTIC